MVLPRVIAFDGDDTLWHNETLFSMTQNRFCALLTRHVDITSQVLRARLFEIEQRHLAVYGYGIKGFVLSMVETAISDGERFPPRISRRPGATHHDWASVELRGAGGPR
jgi:putative hydrolase of the HAD superfamily